MGLEGLFLLAAFGLEQDYAAVFACGGKVLAVWREGDAANPALLLDRLLRLLLRDVPNDDLAVVAAGDQRLAVGRRRHRPDDRRLPLQAGGQRAALGVPDFQIARPIEQALAAAADELRARRR